MSHELLRAAKLIAALLAPVLIATLLHRRAIAAARREPAHDRCTPVT